MLLSFCSLTPRWLLFFHLAIWGSLLSAAAAVKLITEETAPAGLSPGCLEALTADVPCSLYVPRFRAGFFYSEKILNEACTADCEAGLLAYEASVVSACSDDTWEGYDDDDERGEQLGTIPSLLRYFYSVICLQDEGRWCNVIAGIAAQLADPGSENRSPYVLVTVTQNTEALMPAPICKKTAQDCSLERLRRARPPLHHAICASSRA